MTAIQNILFSVDFSPTCVGMAPFVKKGAAMFSARVMLAAAGMGPLWRGQRGPGRQTYMAVGQGTMVGR